MLLQRVRFVCQVANLATWQLGNGHSVQPSWKTCSTAQSARRRGAKRRRGRNHVAWGTDRFPSCQVPSLNNDRSSLAVVTSAALPALVQAGAQSWYKQAGWGHESSCNERLERLVARDLQPPQLAPASQSGSSSPSKLPPHNRHVRQTFASPCSRSPLSR